MNPILIFLLLFIATPLVELYVLIVVGSEIGALNTIGFTLLTAAIGGYLVRMQGLSTAVRANETMARGEVPALEMMEGLALLLSGIMLLLPGFITDGLGFIMLVPGIRRGLLLLLLRRATIITPHHGATPTNGQDIEGEYEEVDEPPKRIDRDENN